MATSYFKGIKTLAGAASRYKNLARKHHPDMGGDKGIMQDINAQYFELLRRLKEPVADPVEAKVFIAPVEPEVAEQDVAEKPFYSEKQRQTLVSAAIGWLRVVVNTTLEATEDSMLNRKYR